METVVGVGILLGTELRDVEHDLACDSTSTVRDVVGRQAAVLTLKIAAGWRCTYPSVHFHDGYKI